MVNNVSKDNRGQSTIEFIFGFTFALGSLFLFLKMAINYTNGFMLHHATYMASRTYLVSDLERADIADGDKKAFDAAKRVFDTYLPSGLISNMNGELKENNASIVKYPAFVGVWYEMKNRFSAGIIGGTEEVILRSESFLGREPTKSESVLQTCKMMKKAIQISGGGDGPCEIPHSVIDDNGG